MMKGLLIVGLLLLNIVAESQSRERDRKGNGFGGGGGGNGNARYARNNGNNGANGNGGEWVARKQKDRLRNQHNQQQNNYNSHISVHNPLSPQQHHTNTEDNHTEFVKGKICIGTKSRLSVPSNREHHYRNLRDRYNNCTYVDGNLELTWLQDTNLDLSFLEHIREVTGYILISHVDMKRVVLPRLQIIRGRTLFKLNVQDEEYSLFATYSKMYTLEMPALRDILDGSVGFNNNFNLCHVKGINWKEIMSGQNVSYHHIYNFTVPERECPRCHSSCEGGCWGEGPQNCQKFSKINCSPQCSGGRCFGQRPRECCHLFCAGGCTGPTQSDCIACKNFYDDGVCKQECPPMQKYNPTNYLWEPNPEGKYAYGATCVKNCPEHLLKDNGACVRTCPINKTAKNGECVPCNGPCPKTCPGAQVLDSGNIDNFKGCTIIEGSLRILDQTFSGYQEVYKNYSMGPRYVRMHPDRLEVFSTVKEITGYLDIQGCHEDFKNLSYFRNLEVIHGRQLMENYFASFTILLSSLQSLELKSLKRINSGSVVIQKNANMCFADSIAWAKIQKSQDPVVVIEKNANQTECIAKGLVCSTECNRAGCWGAGSDQCLECKNFEYNGTCITDCKDITNAYKFNNKTCKTCDPECKSCTGPGPENCIECVHVRNERICLAACPTDKYSDMGICKPCHETCEGCTGPDNTIRFGGCTTCDKAIIGIDNSIEQCLRKNENCPEGYYYEYVQPQELGYLKPLAGKAICRKCHPRCERCTGYGFHEQVCQKCAGYKRGEQCEDECSLDHYADEIKRECFECHSECRGCSGPGMDDCRSCRNFKVFMDGADPSDNSTLFNCTEKCPHEYPFKNFDDIGSFCSAAPPRGSKLNAGTDTQIVLISTFVILFGVLCVLAFLAYSCRQNNKANEEAVKMTMVLSGCEDSEPLRPSNVGPNLTKLRIVKEAELRKGGVLGMGAFGRVFKGVWVPENENVKIPVAIKELLKVSGSESSKEFLEEAYIMASVEHPNLLKLLAICMTSQMMLITQLMPLGCLLDYVRNNKDKIGSKALLNWSTQIARGMSYLEERRLVHRDLAARNVLVQTPSIVKITDFGLAKLLNNDNEYKAAGGKMPIKWLALECIRHRVFTSKSDIWAFGVTIWELLTFGCRPHENIPAKDIPDLIEVGLKLEQPEICSLDIFCTLLSCWHLDAEMRPTFKQLVAVFAEFARDPGRYLMIPGDKFTRLPSYTSQDEKDLIRKLAPTFDSPEPILENEDYLQPKQARPGPSHEIGDDGIPKIIRYCKDPMKKLSHEDDETDSYTREVGVGNLRLDLPVDEDDYLMPTCQTNGGVGSASAPGHYMDLLSVPSSVDNPEYLMNTITTNSGGGGSGTIKNSNGGLKHNNHRHQGSTLSSAESPVPTQTLGIPVIVNIPTPTTSSSSTSSSSSNSCNSSNSNSTIHNNNNHQHNNNNNITEGEQTSSDHEYYNDLQRELQPLHRSETTV